MLTRLALTFIAASALIHADSDPPPITLEIYSDFQCPFCRMFAPAAREVESEGIEGVPTKVVFKNFPLSFHPNAQLAAQAAAAAGEQGKFWEMHDLLFGNQNALGREDLLKNAEKLGLDMDKFRRDLDSDAVKQKIAADKAEGDSKHVEGTPTFFLNGKEYSGTKTTDELKTMIRGEAGRRIALTEVTDNMMTKGPASAPITLEFYADLESPVSRSADYLIEEVMAKYPGRVRLQFRNYPLSFHPQAAMAHTAAMAAAREGHFWEMANYIFDHQDTLRDQDLIEYAGRLGLDQAKFAEALRTHKYAPRVDVDLAAGAQKGVRGSPVLLINDKHIDGVPSVAELKALVEEALNKPPSELAKK